MSRPAKLSGTLWPVHLKPLDDELLSSWMIRLARAYEIKPMWFWRLFWPVDFREIDVEAPGGLLGLLAAKTATPFARALATTLTMLAREHRVVRQVRYCRACIADDPEPYFRRRWQLHSFLLCEMHGIPLSSGCPHWRHEVMPEKVPLTRDSMAWCSQCGEDLRTTQRDFMPSHPLGQVLDWQKRLWMLLRDSQYTSIADGVSSEATTAPCLPPPQLR